MDRSSVTTLPQIPDPPLTPFKPARQEVFKKWEPLFIVLVILGVIGLGAGTIGLAKFGRDLGWWAAGSVSNLGQIHCLIVMAAGFLGGIACLIPGIIGLVKINRKQVPASKSQPMQMEKIPEEEAPALTEFKVLEGNSHITAEEVLNLTVNAGWPIRAWEALLKGSSSFFSIKDKAKLVAFARVIKEGTISYVSDFSIHKDYQEKGINTLLLNHLLEKIKKDKSQIFLVLGKNPPNLFQAYQDPQFPEKLIKLREKALL